MTLLDRHIFRSALLTCLAAVGVFGFVLVAVNMFKDLLGPGLAGQIPVTEIIRLVGLLVPFVLIYALPMGMLLGVLLTLGRLSADNEVTAMRAAGISLKRIAAPVLVLGLAGFLGSLPINFESMPKARVTYDSEFVNALQENPLAVVVPRTFVRYFTNMVIYVGAREGSKISDVWIWRLDADKRVTNLYHAQNGVITYDPKTNELVLTPTVVVGETMPAKDPENFLAAAPALMKFGSIEPIHLPLAAIAAEHHGRKKVPWMTYAELHQERDRRAALPVGNDPKEHARQVMQISLAIAEKYNLSFAALTFAFVGLPLGIKVSRRETSANLILAVILALSWYVLTVGAGLLDRRPDLRPDLLLWTPNLVFLFVGVYLFRRMDRA